MKKKSPTLQVKICYFGLRISSHVCDIYVFFFSGYVSYILYIHSTCTVLTVVTNYLTVYKTYTQTGVYMSLPSGMLNTPFLNLMIINHCVWIYGNSN